MHSSDPYGRRLLAFQEASGLRQTSDVEAARHKQDRAVREFRDSTAPRLWVPSPGDLVELDLDGNIVAPAGETNPELLRIRRNAAIAIHERREDRRRAARITRSLCLYVGALAVAWFLYVLVQLVLLVAGEQRVPLS